MKKAIYFNQIFNESNPPSYATCLTYDKDNGLQLVNDRKQISISTTDTEQNNKIDVLMTKINELEEIIDNKTKEPVNQFDDTYYSAFEVMPNKVEIPANDEYKVAVPACTIHKFTLRSSQLSGECDVVIDWGDGNIESISGGNFDATIPGKSYELSHDYADSMNEDVEKFIIKIYGKDYYTFRNNLYEDNNLICRIFDKDLPIASHIGNFASMCFGATRLLNVTIPHSTKYVTTAFNFSSTFQGSKNLISIIGFENSPLRNDCLISNIFRDCVSLTKTDFCIPSCVLSIAGIFKADKSLTSASRLIPTCGVLTAGKINILEAWENVPDSIKATIPTSLGGTKIE